jgi:hypothetical protein
MFKEINVQSLQYHCTDARAYPMKPPYHFVIKNYDLFWGIREL